jgi:hypothetical protein
MQFFTALSIPKKDNKIEPQLGEKKTLDPSPVQKG